MSSAYSNFPVAIEIVESDIEELKGVYKFTEENEKIKYQFKEEIFFVYEREGPSHTYTLYYNNEKMLKISSDKETPSVEDDCELCIYYLLSVDDQMFTEIPIMVYHESLISNYFGIPKNDNKKKR